MVDEVVLELELELEFMTAKLLPPEVLWALVLLLEEPLVEPWLEIGVVDDPLIIDVVDTETVTPCTSML